MQNMVLDLIGSLFSVPNFDWNKNVVIFGVDNISSVHVDNQKKDILVLGKGPTKRLDDIIITPEAECSINFSRWQRKFRLGCHCNGSNSFLFINVTKIH